MIRRELAAVAFVAAAVALLGAAWWFGSGIHFKRRVATYFTDVTNVGEIEEGAPVMMAGYQVGEVRAIAVLPKPMLHFELQIQIRNDVPIPEGTRAVVTSFGLTGGRYLDLRLPLEIAEGSQPMAPGSRLISEVEPSIGDVIVRANQAFDTLARAAQDVQRFTGASAEEPGLTRVMTSVETTVTDLDASLRNVQSLLAEVERTVKTVTPPLTEGAGEFSIAMKKANGAVEELDAMIAKERPRIETLLDQTTQSVAELRKLVAGYQVENMPELRETLAHLDAATRDLEALMAALRERPLRTIRKGVPAPAPATAP